jgi:N-acetyl-anhydromuramyl-L-alanine amidase AmpD
MTDYASAQWMPNNNFFADTGKKSFIIIHGTAGGSSAQEIANYFKGTEGTANPVSSHYIVGQDGMVIQCINEKDGAYGNGVVTNPNWQGNPNYYTISIEHVKSSTDNSDPLTPAQQAASFALIKDICTRNGIGMHDADDTTGITSHACIDPVNRSRCPNTYPWDALWAYLANGGNTMANNIPTGWTDDNVTLTAPNGKTVTQGFRSYILANAWDPANVPLEEVEAANPVEDYYNQAVNSGTRQMFQYYELAWTSARGVYIVGVGNELLGARKDRDAAKAKVALLQAQVTQLQSQVSSLQSQVASLQDDVVSKENAALKAQIAQAVKDLS